MRNKLIQLETNVVELKASNAKSISCLTNKIDQLQLENKKLVCELNKHKDRNINIQTQLNIFRSKTTMLMPCRLLKTHKNRFVTNSLN